MFILFAERKVEEQHGPAAQGVLAAVQTLREMNADNLRKVPADAPTAFIKPRWKPLVITRKASTGNSTKSAPCPS
ncbi:hypothetical protein ECZU29_61000 [Escherichia coli]|nr:hypothetical protein ECZU29_61000 [Escherichia coli]